MEDNFKKTISVLTLAFGMSVFCGIVLLKVEAWAAKQEAEVQSTIADLEWEGYLYQKTAREVLKKQ